MSEQNGFTEAPGSLNLRFDYRGANVQLTLRDSSGSALLDKLDSILNRLEKMGAVPAGQQTATATATNGGGSAKPVCPTHGTEMKASKHGGFYCPKVISENDGQGNKVYCKAKSG